MAVGRAQLIQTHAKLASLAAERRQLNTKYQDNLENRLEKSQNSQISHLNWQAKFDGAGALAFAFFTGFTATLPKEKETRELRLAIIQSFSALTSKGVDAGKTYQDTGKAEDSNQKEILTRHLNHHQESQRLFTDLLKQIHDAAMQVLSASHQSFIKTS